MLASGAHSADVSEHVLSLARRLGAVVGRTLVYVLIWAGLVLLIAAGVIRFYWGEISVGQLFLNLVSVETDGGGGAVIWIAVLVIGVVPLLLTVGIALRQYFRRHRRRNGDGGRHGQSQWSERATSIALVATLVVGGITAFSTTVGVGEYISAANSKYNLGDYYMEPTVTGDRHKRNLVLIYLESVEDAPEGNQAFEKDALAPLKQVTEISDGWHSVDGLQQYEGGGWTMAGLTSTQCGLPLKGIVPAAGSDVLGGFPAGIDTYLEGSTCLGDVLEDHGYTSVFLGGANPSFAAKDTFLSNHGYSRIKGLSDWRAAGEPEENFRSDWGLSDERLMAHAKDEVDELHAEARKTGQPFNLTLLTLDTHEPVHVFDYCTVDTQNEATSVLACSMTQVAGFVDHMEQQGYLDDTAVVIMGDHLRRTNAGSAFGGQLDDNGNRTIFNRIWVPGKDQNTGLRPRVDQLNMYPTILEAAGLTLKDHEAGLGVSAFASHVPDGSAQALKPNAYTDLLRSRSQQFYAEAWAGEDATR